jgi:hypothetical protein
MINSSISATALGDSLKQLIGKTPVSLVERVVARTNKIGLTAH